MSEMTEIETETDPSKQCQVGSVHQSQAYCLQQTGGHNLTEIKPVFTSDSKYLLVASGTQLRRYVVETGAFLTSHHFGRDIEIVSVQVMTKNGEVMVAFKDGVVVLWDLTEDRQLAKYPLRIQKYEETMIWCQLVSNYFYFTTLAEKGYVEGEPRTKCQLFYSPINVKQKMFVDGLSKVNPTISSVAFSPSSDPKHCLAIDENKLHVYEIPVHPSSEKKVHLVRENKHLTCVVCHPFEQIAATGDSFGQITIWHNFVESYQPARSIWHWHEFAVADLCLSPEGSALYSVGKEMTLVRWSLSGQTFGQNNFLPRLGEPLKYVAIDSNLQMMATAHTDNSIQILGPQMKGVKTVIEGMSVALNGVTTGLLWNSRMKAIALNGRTGHLQFYSPQYQKQLFQLDVVGQNLISSTQDVEVYPTEMTRAAVSEDGLWLSTFEIHDDFETSPEMRLKFWQLKDSLKNFVLNTTIHLPHYSPINWLSFSPDCLSLVSTSDDKEFKIWNLVEDNENKWWKCTKLGNLNDRSVPSMAKWSADSSLLAVVFDHFITLWDYNDKSSLKFMEKLSVEDKKSKLLFIEFGNEDKSYLLIEVRNYKIQVWNLLQLSGNVWFFSHSSAHYLYFSVVWTHERFETITSFAFNKWQNKLAVITNTNITLFDIDSDEELKSIELTSIETPVTAALFTDETCDESEPFLADSKLYIINSKQELFVVCERRERPIRTQIMEWNATDNLTPIALMLMNKKDKSEQISDTQSYFKTNTSISKLVEDMFFNVPSHVLPPIDILSKSFLQSLNNCREKENDEKNGQSFKRPKDFASEPMVASDDDLESDNQSNTSHLDTKERDREMAYTEDENEEVEQIVEDYSWLST